MNGIDECRTRLWKKASEYRMVPWVVGESCCRIELDVVRQASYAGQRLGLVELARDPSEANLLIVSGWIQEQLAAEIKAAYLAMWAPRYVMAVGACAISGSPFKMATSSFLSVADIVPVDVYVPGCPPRPETLLEAILLVRKRAEPPRDTTKAIYDALTNHSRTK